MRRKIGRFKKWIAVLLCLQMVLLPVNGDIRGLHAETMGQESALSEEEGSQSEEMKEEEQTSGKEEFQPEDSLADREENQSEETLPESDELQTEETSSESDRIQPEETLPEETKESEEPQTAESGEEESQPVETTETSADAIEESSSESVGVTVAKTRVITGFAPFEKEVYELEEKPELEALLMQFPQTLEAFVEEEENGIQIPVSWECEGDYADETVTEFRFIPVLLDDAYELGETELPVICVVTENRAMMAALGDTAAVVISADGMEQGYESLEEAIAALKSGETIKLMADCSFSESLWIKKSAIIDLNGYECKFLDDYDSMYISGCNVTFTDTSSEKSGKITAPYFGITILDGSNVSLDTITVEASEEAVSISMYGYDKGKTDTFTMYSGNIIADDYGVLLWKNANFEMYGGTITVRDGFGISGNGSHDGTDILITGDAVVKSEVADYPAIYHPQEGVLTIEGGTIEGGVQFCGAGKANISGGTLIGTAPYTEFPTKPANEDDGSAVDGAALSLISRGDGYQDGDKVMNVTISGGEFISNNNAAISVYRLEKKGNNWITNDKTSVKNYLGSLTITEGIFQSGDQKKALEIDSAAQGTLSISGGLYSDEGEWPYLISADYTIVPEEEMFRVTLKKIDSNLDTEAEDTKSEIDVSEIKVDGADDQKKQEAAETSVENLVQELTGNNAVNHAAVIGLEAAFKKEDYQREEEWPFGITLAVLSIKPVLLDMETAAEFGTPDDDGNVTAVLDVKKLVFDVSPYVTLKNGAGEEVISNAPVSNKYLNGTAIRFRLPVPASIETSQAKVIHIWNSGQESFYADIMKEGSEKYIEVSVSHFSKFEVIFEKPAEDVPPVIDNPDNSGDNSGDNSNNNSNNDSDDDGNDDGTDSLTGRWIRDAKGWWFKYTNGSYPRDGWAYLYYGNRYGWYHFNKEGYMDTGWFTDLDGREYYLNPVSDGYQGIMLTGWVRIGDPWFYFHTHTGGPLGSLVKGTRTPDGYLVDEKGRWIQ